MFDDTALPAIRSAIRECTLDQRHLLDEICTEVQGLSTDARSIKPRTTTSISLVASDGGNNKLEFDPFYVQLVRVVDSYGKEHLLDAVSPSTDTDRLSERHWKQGQEPRTALGRMMRDLDCPVLHDLSHMIPSGEKVRNDPSGVSPLWVQVYRDLCEWAVLYDRICYATFATNTLLVRDSLVRSKHFRGKKFREFTSRIEKAIARIEREDHRKVFLVGVAKHSQVLNRYGLALRLEGVFPSGDAKYVHVPQKLEEASYVWQEWARAPDETGAEGEDSKFKAGDMYFVRFGPMLTDPIWAVDIFAPQTQHHQEVFGYLLADSLDGFPIPFYPRCLQLADGYAQVRGFDLDVLQTEVMSAVEQVVGDGSRDALDAYRLTPDLTGRRYS